MQTHSTALLKNNFAKNIFNCDDAEVTMSPKHTHMRHTPPRIWPVSYNISG